MYYPLSVCTILADASTYSPSAPAQTLSYSGGWERGGKGKVKRGGWGKGFTAALCPQSCGRRRLVRLRYVTDTAELNVCNSTNGLICPADGRVLLPGLPGPGYPLHDPGCDPCPTGTRMGISVAQLRLETAPHLLGTSTILGSLEYCVCISTSSILCITWCLFVGSRNESIAGDC